MAKNTRRFIAGEKKCLLHPDVFCNMMQGKPVQTLQRILQSRNKKGTSGWSPQARYSATAKLFTSPLPKIALLFSVSGFSLQSSKVWQALCFLSLSIETDITGSLDNFISRRGRKKKKKKLWPSKTAQDQVCLPTHVSQRCSPIVSFHFSMKVTFCTQAFIPFHYSLLCLEKESSWKKNGTVLQTERLHTRIRLLPPFCIPVKKGNLTRQVSELVVTDLINTGNWIDGQLKGSS